MRIYTQGAEFLATGVYQMNSGNLSAEMSCVCRGLKRGPRALCFDL